MKISAILRIISLGSCLVIGGNAWSAASASVGNLPPPCDPAASGPAPASGAIPARDWGKYPVVAQVTTSHDIYAIGDTHGDPDRLNNVLLAAGLIEAGVGPDKYGDVKWAAGKAVLVVTGDMIDKYPHALDVIMLLRALQADAASKGGRVIITMGNHEGEFLADPGGKKTTMFANELLAAKMDVMEVGACKTDLGAFLCQLPIAAKVNDWFFSHGGNTGGQTIAALSQSIQNGYQQNGFATKALVGCNSILEARLNDKGPANVAWIYNGVAGSKPKKLLQDYAKALGVSHMVQGHQYGKLAFPDGQNRKKKEFFQRYGLYFLIDTAMSRGIGTPVDEDDDHDKDSNMYSLGGALHITGPVAAQTAMLICANGTQTKLWDSKKNKDYKAQVCGE